MICPVLFVTTLLTCGSFAAVVKRQATVPIFHRTEIGRVTSSSIDEASGLAASRKHPGYLYTHNDHGGDAKIYVLNATSGHLQSTITLKGATSNDWEDIAVGRCQAGNDNLFCIYIADTGDGGNGAVNKVYRFEEPDTITADQEIMIQPSDTLQFAWDQVDCETLMVAPDTSLFIVSKADNAVSFIAQLPSTAWGSNTRVFVSSSARINIQSTKKDPVGGDISFDGTEVLIKAKHAIYYWSAPGGSTTDYQALLTTPGTKVEYIDDEPRGESVCWDASNQGYYTLSEGHSQPLYYYVRST